MLTFCMATDYLEDMMQKAKKVEVKEKTPEHKEEETIKEVKQEDLAKLKQITEKDIPKIEVASDTKENEIEK